MNSEIVKLRTAVDALNEWAYRYEKQIKALKEEIASKDAEIARLGKRFFEDLKGGEIIAWEWQRPGGGGPGAIRFAGYANGWIIYRLADWSEAGRPMLCHISEVCNLQMWEEGELIDG